uniref:Uncharacterized protein n=1 Tax=Oryza nivara TaxID=4536 RepID=A0A0E0FKI2_ORYNI
MGHSPSPPTYNLITHKASRRMTSRSTFLLDEVDYEGRSGCGGEPSSGRPHHQAAVEPVAHERACIMVATRNCGLKTPHRIEPHKSHTTHSGSHSKTNFACQPLSIYMSALVLSSLLKLYILNPIVTKRSICAPLNNLGPTVSLFPSLLFFIPSLSLSLSLRFLLHRQRCSVLFSSPLPSPASSLPSSPSLFPLPPAADRCRPSSGDGGSSEGGEQRWRQRRIWRRRGAAVRADGSMSPSSSPMMARTISPTAWRAWQRTSLPDPWRAWRRRARRIGRWRPQHGGCPSTSPSSSPHDGADELAGSVASLAAAGSPDRAVAATTRWLSLDVAVFFPPRRRR